MFLRRVQSNQRLISLIVNDVSNNVSHPCKSLGLQTTSSSKSIASSTSVNFLQSQKFHWNCMFTKVSLPILSAVVSGSRHYATSSGKAGNKPYKLMRIKDKDLEKVNPDEKFGGLNPTTVLDGYEESKELEDADEIVKRIFSIELANQRQLSKKQVKEFKKKIQLDPENENRYANGIIEQTVMIRHISRRLQSFKDRHDVGGKVQLMNLIAKRRKLLKYLRKQNFAQFEKVTQELGIEWIPAGKYDYYPQTRRMREKEAIIKDAHAKKMAALKVFMKERREAMFLEIANLKKDLGLDLTEEEQERLRKSEETDAAEQ